MAAASLRSQNSPKSSRSSRYHALPSRALSSCHRRPPLAADASPKPKKSTNQKSTAAKSCSPSLSHSITPPPVIHCSDSDIEACVSEVVPGTSFRLARAKASLSSVSDSPENGDEFFPDDEPVDGDDDYEEGDVAIYKKSKVPRVIQREEEEEESESEADEDIDIEFTVALDSTASEDITLSSAVEFKSFLTTIAESMDLTLKELRKLQLTYKFSTANRDVLPKLLATDAHFSKMIKNAVEELNANGKGKKKKFVIDIREKKKMKESASSKGKKGTKRKHIFEDDSDVEPAERKKSLAEYQSKLKKKHLCPRCTTNPDDPVYCYHVGGDPTGPCIRLNDEKITHWGAFMSKGWPHDTIPPPMLYLTDEAKPSSKRAKIAEAAPAQPPQIIYALPPHPYAQPSYPYAQPAHSPIASPKKFINLSIYPTVSKWLEDLDSGHRGIENDHFAQYSDSFTVAGYRRLIDLAEMDVVDIQATCAGIPRGTAAALSRYAKEDRKQVEFQARRG
ncbi:hypothetical protein C8J56DRAFT_1040394 [Mycena floridula]|nr:hypothetical protein C8J56DRAFT_1040394 [Mycena floridula]